ncbi:CO dehydrogenase/acetyl-CoA synthase delta subunit [Desulfopila aestuarii DSM 18488]|uniref:CO dehydrogenase/acetyl-CoA synthase delta subunit n=1 Tax=Desulfopila aestuarii DSM 18488 TaxID=1121416 RepID=A0A1M7YCA7_9BACT|nr:CO dehydrogenase/acetyl-CoA synthase delta subunit [Desulfopila aestuarii DSM 18488]
MATALTLRDHLGTIGARTGFVRNSYKITPGLYAIGQPSPEDPVIVTANYKLTFDAVRSSLATQNLWLLVVDTRGINVWCAAGKGTFSTEEVAYQVRKARLTEIVSHRKLILPQLAASGVAAIRLKDMTSFRAAFGPLRIADLPRYLSGSIDDFEQMRSITFTAKERLVLIPVEVCMMYKQLALSILFVVLISGIGPDIFSARMAISRTWQFILATGLAILAGAVITPLALPWLPGRQFWLKGLSVSIFAGLIFTSLSSSGVTATLALALWILAVGSYLAMNFTGSTPYTSLSGVEAEMRKGLPVQIGLAALALLLWLVAPFITQA